MKLTDIFTQRIVCHNCTIDDSLAPAVREGLLIHQDRLSFNYECLYTSGLLRSILKDPKNISWHKVDIQFREQNLPDSHFNGWHLLKGADYILPLIFCRNALIARLQENAKETEVLFCPGMRGDVECEIWEMEEYFDDIRSVYQLHLDLTRKYYRQHIEKLSDEECPTLLCEIENIEFTAAFLR